MDNLSQLRQRKAELKIQIEQQRAQLKKTVLEVREEIEPANLIKKAVNGWLGVSKAAQQDGTAEALGKLPPPLGFVADLLIKDRRIAMLVKILAPLAIKYIRRPKKTDSAPVPETAPEEPPKQNMYGKLRRGISKLRNQLKKNPPPPPPDPIEFIPKPSEN